MKWSIKAQAFDRKTGDVSAPMRREIIDSTKNQLFVKASTILDVKTIYESFWNDLNPESDQVVFVQSVTILE